VAYHDVRGDYRLALEEGLDDQAAQQRVLEQFADVVDDDTWNGGPLVWLALAKIQWQLGRLDERVKAEALAVIDQGRDLASWEGSDLYGYRRAVLRGLRQHLTSPSPPSKQVRPPRRPDPEAVRHRLPYQEGSLFQVSLRDGRSVRGLVSRLDPSSGLIVADFFGPAAQWPWMEQPAQVALKLPARPEHIARCPDASLRRRRWPALGRLDAAAWTSWPQPPYDQPPSMASFVGTDCQTPRCPEEASCRHHAGGPERTSGRTLWGPINHHVAGPWARGPR
jgi:hypothetical protein